MSRARKTTITVFVMFACKEDNYHSLRYVVISPEAEILCGP